MWNRIKNYFTTNDPMRAVHFLSGGFALLFIAFVGLGIIHVHDEKEEREQNAHLLAADILRLRDASDEGSADLYSELIRVRIGGILSERDSRSFTELLRDPSAVPLLTAVGAGIENALNAGSLSAKHLRRILEEAIREVQAETPLASDNDAATVTVPGVSAVPRVDPIAVAEQFFGVQNLFQGATSADKAVTVSYCDNVYAVFDGRTGRMSAYVAECDPGAPHLSDGECVRAAVDYASLRQGMRVLSPGEAVASRGIYFVQLHCRGDYNALIGVRQDTGRICLFLRTVGK